MAEMLMTLATMALVFGLATAGVALTAVAILKLGRALKRRGAQV